MGSCARTWFTPRCHSVFNAAKSVSYTHLDVYKRQRLGIDIADYRQMLLDTNNSQLFSYDEWREEHGDSIEPVSYTHLDVYKRQVTA